MTLPGVPGIIDGSMTVTTEPDGRLSLRVLAAVVPCHIGFFRNAA
jgi:hypothetical protein